MRQDNFYRLKARIQSLTDSTFLKVSCRYSRTTATLDGRCSPYVTHRSVEFDLGADDEGVVVLENGGTRLVIEPDQPAEERVVPGVSREEPIEGYIPNALLWELRGEMALVGYELQFKGLAFVRFFVPIFVGYDENGEPIYLLPDEKPEDTETEIEDEDEDYLGTDVREKPEQLNA